MSDRKYNEEQYRKQQITGNDLHNAAVCNQIADESLEWNPNEAVYWRKLAVEHAENHYGKSSIENTSYYEKLASDYLEQGSRSQALKWNSKARKIKIRQLGEYALALLENELFELQVYGLMYKYDEISNVRERIKILLEKNPDCEETVLYKVYSEMAQHKKSDGNFEFVDAAMRIAEKVYGEISMEMAEIYRIKAIETWQFAEEQEDQERKKEAVKLNNKAYYIATHAKDDGRGSHVLSGIQRNMLFMRLPDELSYEELRAMIEKNLPADNSEVAGQDVDDCKGNDSEEGLSMALGEKLEALYEKGNQLEREERYEEALQAWQEGYALIPADSRLGLEATNRFLAAIGDVYFLRKGMYQEAYECFDAARGYGGYGNPFIMLRLGECCLELGNEKNAAEYLLRAWMMEGEEIFGPDENGEDDGSKYYEFLRAHVDLEKLK